MNSLNSIIQQCHQRHEKSLRQRKTEATPAMYTKEHPHQYTVYCAHRYPVMLHELEQAHISFMPIGRAPWNDQGPEDNMGKRLLKRQGTRDWEINHWNASWGIKIYTGIPSERNGARWHNLHFKYEAICAAPDAVADCIEILANIVNKPLVTLGKSGGLRFSCRVRDYLHSKTESAKLYIYKDTQKMEQIYHREVYLEIFGEEGQTRWDARYEILAGDLLDPPVIDKEVLFAPIDVLRTKLHEPAPNTREPKKIVAKVPLTLGSENLDLAKEAFLQRGFSYLRKDLDVHYWTQSEETDGGEDVLLSERDGVVWLRASTHNSGLPTQPTPITDVWEDTGISYPIDMDKPPIRGKMNQVRKDELSPLAIKRPPPVLDQEDNTEKDVRLQRDVFQIEHVFDRGVRILGIITGIGPWDKQAEETFFHGGGTITVNTPNIMLAEGAEKHFQEQNMPSVVYWKPRTHRWEAVKDIPIQDRIKTPFQWGNVCVDAEKCITLEEKGRNPNEIICPQCLVYDECHQSGYLSQFSTSQSAKVQLLTIPQLFFDPDYYELVEQILKREDGTERLCVINQQRTHRLFLECQLTKNVMDEWATIWQGAELGNFAKTLLSALDIKDKLYEDAVKGVRAAIQTFELQEDKLIQQMCQMIAHGRLVEQELVDPDTREILSRYIVKFEGGISAYIPSDSSTADKLKEMGLLVIDKSLPLNETVKVPMSMSQAIEFGFLKTDTVACIQKFPVVAQHQDWTYWHQLKRFFTHYKRNADAPIRWDGEVLRFKVPPVLHTSVKRLLLVSSVFSDEHLHRVFTNGDLQTHWTEPIPWSHGSRVFQVRTGTYPSEAILDYHNWSHVRLSDTGQRFLSGIKEEIDRDLNVEHGIITTKDIAIHLDDIAKKRNVCCVDDFQKIRITNTISEAADVIWVIGTPQRTTTNIWHRAQMLYGNAVEPLSYEFDIESGTYKDPRIQSISEEDTIYSLTEIIVKAELDRLTDRRIILIAGVPLPNITNRPETSIFDWEDFEIAGGLEKLPEIIAIRERFEQERENLTADSSREEVQRILGCSERQANRVLQRLRGGNIQRKTFREQILSLLSDGEKKTAEFTTSIDGHPEAIQHELARLVESEEIVRIRRGVYALPEVK